MEYKEANKRIITDLKYKAVRAYDMRGPKMKNCNIFVGWNPNLRKHIVAVHPAPDVPALIKVLGSSDGLMSREQLIDCALAALDGINGNLIVYPEPGYEKPHDNTF